MEAGLQQIKEPTTFHIKIIGHLLAGPSELRHVTTNFVNGLAHDNQLMNMVSLTSFRMVKSCRNKYIKLYIYFINKMDSEI